MGDEGRSADAENLQPEMMEEDTLTVEKTERGVHVQMRITTTGDENVFFDQTIS